MWTGISGVGGGSIAALNLAGEKLIYTTSGNYVHEASSYNGWRNLNSGVRGSTVAVLSNGGVKLIYAA